MAITYAAITGKVTDPGGSTPIRARVEFIPETTDGVIAFPGDGVTQGPETRFTSATDGTLTEALQIPVSGPAAGVVWRVVVTPLDRGPNGHTLAPWTRRYEITADARLDELVVTDALTVTPTLVTSVQTYAADAEAARDAAQAAAGVWQPSTAYSAGAVAQAPDGSRIKRTSAGTSRATFDATEQAAWTAVLATSGTVEQAALRDQTVGRVTSTAHAPALGMFFPEVEGADPTGVADSSAALAAAYTAAAATGGKVILTGTYKQSSTWVLNATKTVQIHGFGATLKPDAGIRSLRFNAGSAQTSSATEVYGVVIDGGSATTGGSGVEIRNHFAATMRDVKIRNCVHGILVTDASGGWSESSVLDNVITDNCTTGIEFATNGGTGSFGYLSWGFVGVYNVPDNGTGFKVGNGAFIYHGHFGTLLVQIQGDNAKGWDIAGAMGRNTYVHFIIESSASTYATRVGINFASTAVVDAMGFRGYFQGTYSTTISNSGNIPFQFRDSGDRTIRGWQTTNTMLNSGIIGDTTNRFELKADGQMNWGPGGSASTDCTIFRAGNAHIRTDGRFSARRTTGSAFAFSVLVTGESAERWVIDASGKHWFGDGVATQDTSIERSAAKTLSMGVDNAFRTGRNVTASRPSATTVGVGAQFYDTTLQKPIWSDGTNWRDAAGTVV